MEPINYAEFVHRISKPGEEIIAQLTPKDAELWHMATGVASEAGEVADVIKKAVVYRKTLDLPHLIEELGDLEFFMQEIRTLAGLTREQVIAANIEKLGKRYPLGQYSNQQAQERADKK